MKLDFKLLALLVLSMGAAGFVCAGDRLGRGKNTAFRQANSYWNFPKNNHLDRKSRRAADRQVARRDKQNRANGKACRGRCGASAGIALVLSVVVVRYLVDINNTGGAFVKN